MSLDKAIEHGKEKRKPYYRSKRFDHSCRPGGDCPWCQEDRHVQDLKLREKAETELADVDDEDGV